ncbi:hypothetical protein KAK07_20575 [Ideonella sp. 4Y16]|uniref:Uncharacterized protein n=1 Tax=Ideonella alba TaxID=2824118 RepID=A0A940YF27_9BURK|nr:hypothetical protein [Ideonella alba]MBQ0933008.1 hypothetical protein [Ideonella alba]MBQ0945747.1 hypothetical protein [Ideonella alba]
MTDRRPVRAAALAAALLLATPLLRAQTADFQNQGNSLQYSSTPVNRLVVANVQSKVGVSLERLTLISGEGHEDKKITAGLLAGAATLLSMRAGGGIGGAGGIDFADREPIEDHLSKDDARRIGEEALAIVVEKLRAAGVAVDGPEKVAAAPFMAEAKGESEVSTDSAQDKGSLFRKAYYYGFYCTPVAGLKYRKPGMFEGMGDSDYYPKARAAAGAPGALDLTIAFYNDKKVFGLHEFQARVWGQVKGRDADVPMYAELLKNKDDFTVPSGGKDTLAYWQAMRPKFEALAGAFAARLAKAMPPAGS